MQKLLFNSSVAINNLSFFHKITTDAFVQTNKQRLLKCYSISTHRDLPNRLY